MTPNTICTDFNRTSEMWQNKINRTSDETIHYLDLAHFLSYNNGIDWILNENLVERACSFDIDLNDDLVVIWGDGSNRLGWSKGEVNKTGSTWTWSFTVSGTIDSAACLWTVADFLIDGNGIWHAIYGRIEAPPAGPFWARSNNQGTSWTITDLQWDLGERLYCGITKDSSNNLYIFGLPEEPFSYPIYSQKITFSGGSWSFGDIYQLSVNLAWPGEFKYLKSDHLAMCYNDLSVNKLIWRRTTNPQDLSIWNDEIIFEENYGERSGGVIISPSSSRIIVMYYWLDGTKYVIVKRESQDSGITFGDRETIYSGESHSYYPSSSRHISIYDYIWLTSFPPGQYRVLHDILSVGEDLLLSLTDSLRFSTKLFGIYPMLEQVYTSFLRTKVKRVLVKIKEKVA